MDGVQKQRLYPVVVLFGIVLLMSGCQGLNSSGDNSGGGGATGDISSLKHIVFMVQENRSFDTYLGQLPAYWAANGYPSQQFNGMPANASNPSFDGLTTVNAYHLGTVCFENLSPSWNESHQDWNREFPTSNPPTLDGYVYTAGKFAQDNPPNIDVEGIRAMGYYDGSDLNYYYFMASNFATSDNWFSPVMTRTQPNRLYLLAATSAGYVYPPTATLPNKTIFEALDNAGITWKIYETDPGSTYLLYFQPFAGLHAANIVPIADYLTDVQNGTLPAVAMIESGYNSGRDEHPENNAQTGAAYAASLINALMASPSWKDSAFILTYDEAGGLYDHVAPIPAVSPDGIPPQDLAPGDTCTGNGGVNCDFTYTGFRVPLLVVSPFTRKNFVSHTPADFTAILRLIEKRFGINPLTNRDAAQMTMEEFFDFQNVPWATPPAASMIPTQATNGVCDYQKLKP